MTRLPPVLCLCAVVTVSVCTATEPSAVGVAPFLPTAWGQTTANNNPTGTRYVYNYYTPGHEPCGCVATALAQVLYYHRSSKTVAAKSVACTVDGSSAALTLKGGTYDWDDMPTDPFSVQYTLTDGQKQAIGKLCYDAAVSLGSSFGAQVTSAKTADSAASLTEVFGYRSARVVSFEKECDDFDLSVYVLPELDAQRPVIMGIGTLGQTGGGHCVVVDGYGRDDDDNILLHLNLGFCGKDNGWYAPSDFYFPTSGSRYASIRQIVYDIIPGAEALELTASDGNSLKKAVDAANVATSDVTIQLTGTITANSVVAFANPNPDVTVTVLGPAVIKGYAAAALSTNKAKIIFRNVTVEKGVASGITIVTDEVPDATDFPETTVIRASGQRQVYFGWPTLKGVTDVRAQVLAGKEWTDLAASALIRRDAQSAEPTVDGWASLRYVGATPGSTAFYRLVATTAQGTSFASEATEVTTAAAGTLHSRSGAKATIYLDFDGYVDDYAGNASAARANYIATPVFPDRTAIRSVWRSVAEDFAIFDVDVTTEEPVLDRLVKSDAADANYGKRVVFDSRTGADKWYVGAGGVSGLGAFGFRTDRPAFIFGTTTDNIACQATHEISHTLGLVHDGGDILIPKGSEIYENGKWTTVETEYTVHSDYFSGQRVSLNCTWYPVMGGVPTADGGDYINQFANGNYDSATNTEDDFAVITGRQAGAREGNVVVFPAALYPSGTEEGFWKLTLLPDDAGNGLSDATAYQAPVSALISPDDVDVFRFTAGKGRATVKVSPEYAGSSYGCSLDAKVELLDATGAVLAASENPLQGHADDGQFRKAELVYDLPSDGTYYARVSGTFHETPASMKTAYGSVGPYVLTVAAEPVPETRADYVLISPSAFVSDWTDYVAARRAAHPGLTFAVKNADEIYRDYAGSDPSEQIRAFIREMVGRGTRYVVLGGAWSDPATIAKCEESFVVTGQNGDKYGQLALSPANTIPGFLRTFSGKTLATDYPYALADDDQLPDVALARIPLVPWPKADGSVPAFSEMIAGYGRKVAAVESATFAGTHRYACAAGQLGSSVARGSAYWPTERHAYADGYYDFFDARHPDTATDGEIAARRRFRDYFAMNNPVKGAMVVPVGSAATDFFADPSGWEAIVAKCHGLEGEAYGTGLTDARFRETTTLVKLGVFAMPCLTGRPDRTTTWNGWSSCRLPSMGVAAICNPAGGEVVGFHNTHDGAGRNDVALVTTNGDPYATQYEGFLLEALCKDRHDAGTAWRQAHANYLTTHGTGTWHQWTAYESVLYGDPLVRLSAVDGPVCGRGSAVPRVLFK